MMSKQLKIAIKIIVLVMSYGFIIYKFSTSDDIFNSFKFFKYLNFSSFLMLMAVLMLMLVNWGLESKKWQLLVKRLQKISFKTSFIAVFAGVAVSIFTPNRTGEYGGRVFALEPQHRIRAVFSTIVGSISQLSITMVAGLTGISTFLMLYPEQELVNKTLSIIIVVLGCIGSATFLFFYFNINLVDKILSRITWFKKYKKYFSIIGEYTPRELLEALIFSALRYGVFILQFYLLLQFFHVDIGFIQALVCVSITYFILAFIPTITLAEIGVRGTVSVLIIGIFVNNITGITSATVLLWLINLAIPALLGAVFFMKYKL